MKKTMSIVKKNSHDKNLRNNKQFLWYSVYTVYRVLVYWIGINL